METCANCGIDVHETIDDLCRWCYTEREETVRRHPSALNWQDLPVAELKARLRKALEEDE